MFLMVGIIIYCDIFYGKRITEALTRADNPIVPDSSTAYILNAQKMLGSISIKKADK